EEKLNHPPQGAISDLSYIDDGLRCAGSGPPADGISLRLHVSQHLSIGGINEKIAIEVIGDHPSADGSGLRMGIRLLLIRLRPHLAELHPGRLNQTRREEYRGAAPRPRLHRGCRDDSVAREIILAAKRADQTETLHTQLACTDGAKGFARLPRFARL